MSVALSDIDPQLLNQIMVDFVTWTDLFNSLWRTLIISLQDEFDAFTGQQVSQLCNSTGIKYLLSLWAWFFFSAADGFSDMQSVTAWINHVLVMTTLTSAALRCGQWSFKRQGDIYPRIFWWEIVFSCWQTWSDIRQFCPATFTESDKYCMDLTLLVHLAQHVKRQLLKEGGILLS